jgi:hypothetical protein
MTLFWTSFIVLCSPLTVLVLSIIARPRFRDCANIKSHGARMHANFILFLNVLLQIIAHQLRQPLLVLLLVMLFGLPGIMRC